MIELLVLEATWLNIEASFSVFSLYTWTACSLWSLPYRFCTEKSFAGSGVRTQDSSEDKSAPLKH